MKLRLKKKTCYFIAHFASGEFLLSNYPEIASDPTEWTYAYCPVCRGKL